MQPQEKVNAAAHGLLALAALVAVATWPQVRTPAAAVSVTAIGQLSIWLSVPTTWNGKPPRTLVVLEAALVLASVALTLAVSAWFAAPAVFGASSTAGLILARRAGARVLRREAGHEAPRAAPGGAGVSVEELRALHPALTRVGVAFMTFFLVLASICAIAVVRDPGALVGVATCLALAGSVRFAEWLTAKSTTPSEREALERRRRDRTARAKGRGRGG
jgi:hypothetical protein